MYKTTKLQKINTSNVTKRSWTSLTNCLTGKGISVLGNVFANITLKKRPVYKNIDKAKIFLSFNSYIP